jgi:hypothetical protein
MHVAPPGINPCAAAMLLCPQPNMHTPMYPSHAGDPAAGAGPWGTPAQRVPSMPTPSLGGAPQPHHIPSTIRSMHLTLPSVHAAGSPRWQLQWHHRQCRAQTATGIQDPPSLCSTAHVAAAAGAAGPRLGWHCCKRLPAPPNDPCACRPNPSVKPWTPRVRRLQARNLPTELGTRPPRKQPPCCRQ